MNVKYENKLSSNKNPLVIDKYTSILKTSCEAVETLKKSNKFPIQLNRETLLEGMIPIEINQFLNSLKNIKDNQNKYSYLTKKSNNKFNKNSDITESKSGLFDPANKPSNTQRRRAEVKKRSSKAFEKQANNTHNGSKFNLKPLNSELKTLSTGTDLKIESDRTFTHFNFDDTNNFSKTLGLNKELWKNAQFTKELLRKTNNRLYQNMKDTSEISYLHLDPEETQFKKTLSNINHIQDNQNNSQLINIEQLPNFYSKMCQLDKIKPDYTTSLSDLKSKVKINPLEITKILDPVLFNEENVSLLSEHLNNSKQKSLAFHTSQNKNLTKPSIRKDVKYLDSWLKDMLGQIEQRKSDYSFQAMIEDLQIIYSACLQELIKQISLHCSERGQMVERIWNCYLDLLEKAIINTNKEKSQMEKQFLSDITRIYNGFEKETDNYKKEISNLKSKNQESSEKISQYYNELLYLRLKNHRSEKENGFLRSHSEDLLKDLKEMANQLYNYQTSTEINLEKSQNFEKLEEKKTNFLKVHDKYKKTFIKEIENLVNREYEIEENTIAEKGVNTEELYKEVSESIVTNEPLQILQSKEEKQFPEIVNKIFSDMKKKENVISHKEIQVNLKDFIACPELINPSSESFDEISNKIEQEKDIFDKKEKVILDTLKSFDKLTKKILLTQKDHSNEKIKNAFHMIKSHLVENLEIKRELFAINEELSYFVKENKKLRYTYQKNQSDLEEINERFSILNETYDSLQKKVNIFKKTIGKISKHQELIESFNRNEKELDHNRRLSISKVNKISKTEKLLKKCVEKFKSKSKNFTDFNDSDFSPIHELNSKNEEISINFIENENKKVVKEDLINIQEKQIKQKANEEKIKVNIGEQIAKNIQIQKQTSLNKIELFQNNQSKGKMSIILIEPDDKDPKKAWNQNDILENYENNDKFKNRIEPKKQVLDFFNHFIFKFKENKEGSDSGVDSTNEFKSELLIQSQKDLTRPLTKEKKTKAHDNSYWNVPNLGVRKNEKKGLSPNFTSAEILLKELISKRDKIHSTSIKKSLLLKFITTVYIDCINRRKENKTSLQAPLHLILYEYFLNKYGLKKTAEKKLKQVFEACFYYRKSSIKLELFNRFIGIEDSLDITDFNYYLDWMKDFDNNNTNGIQIAASMQDKIQIPYVKTLENIEKNLKNNTALDHYNYFLKKIEEIKEESLFSKEEVIDFNAFMKMALELFSHTKENVKLRLKNIFFASDLDQNEMLEYSEFLALYQSIETENSFDENLIRSIFIKECDLIISTTDEKALSLDKFVYLSIKNNFFKKEAVEKFIINVPIYDTIKTFKDLEKNWAERKEIILNRFLDSNSYNSKYKKLLQLLEENLISKKFNEEILWINYRILDEQSKKLILESSVNRMIPIEFIVFVEEYREVLDKIEI